MHVRAVWKHARKKRIVTDNPCEDLKAKSKNQVCERILSVDECRRLFGAVLGRDGLILRIFIQLGLRPEELFALRRDDLEGETLRIDEAIVEGRPAPVKTKASEAPVCLPPQLASDIRAWIDCSLGEPHDWLFSADRGRPIDAHNYLARVLKPAAVRAGVGVKDTGKRDKDGEPILSSDVNFQALRRTCATLFGSFAKDPRLTQAQLRHADPSMTLRVYQKALPASIMAVAIAYEQELFPAQSPTDATVVQ